MTSAVQAAPKRGLISRLLSYENALVFVLALTWGLVFFDRRAINALSPFIVKALSLSNTQLGVLSSGLSGTWALSAYLIGRWSDAKGSRKPFLLTFTLIFSTCSFLSGLAPNFMILLLSRVIMGAAEGPFLPVCYAILNAESTPSRRGLNSGFVQGFFSTLLAGVVAPILLVWLANTFSWRAAFFVAGAPGLLCLLAIWLFVREPPKLPHHVGEAAAPEAGARMSLWQMIRVRNIWICCLISIFMVAQLIVVATFLPTFFTRYRHFSTADMAWVIGLAAVAGQFGFLVPGLSDRVGRKPILIGFSFLTMLAPLSELYFHGPLLMLALLMLIGQLGGGIFPLFMGIVPGESIPRRFNATAMGLVVCVGEVAGGFLAPTVAGVVADHTSLATPIVIGAACGFFSGLLALFIKETAPSKMERQLSA